MSHSETVFPPSARVSRTLERELRSELRSGLQVWLDKDGTYSDFVATLREAAGEGGFSPVVTYRGSFLQMLHELQGKTADSLQSPPLLIHMPGFNEDEIRQTPMLSYYHAGKRYRRKLETLIENAAAGLIDPDAIQSYLAGEVTTLEAADQWLSEQLGTQGSQLQALDLDEIWERLAGFKERDSLGEDPEDVRKHLRVRVSMDSQWLAETGLEKLFDHATESARKFQILGDTLLSWAMAVEFVNDLRREPHVELLRELPNLNQKYVEECCNLVRSIRGVPRYEAAYMRVANDFAGKLSEEAAEASAEDLGDVDTFLFEDDLILTESLDRLTEGDTTPVLSWASRRSAERSIWLRNDRDRDRVWSLIRAAARLDGVLQDRDDLLSEVYTIDEAVVRYRDELWEVDQRHRELEQERRLFLKAGMPHFGRVRAMLDTVRARYHDWSNTCATQFAKLCEKEGFNASKDRQQRELFEQVVRPEVKESDRLAFLLLDGFRFEMARELMARLTADANPTTRLDARLTELPSITSVGMNVLAPVAANGRMTPVMKSSGSSHKIVGFQLAGKFQVTRPADRQKAMARRVGGSKCPLMSLDDVLEAENLKGSVQGSGLLIVHSLDLDEAGEVGQGTAAFDNILMRVASAIRQLREAGVKRFVITADHGFLLEPPTDTIAANGNCGARYRFDGHGVSSSETVAASMFDLGYDETSLHVIVPRDTRCFAVAGGARNYVHGGNSLQERVIPVLSVDYKRASGGLSEQFEVHAEKRVAAGGANRISLKVTRKQGALSFATNEELELTLEPIEDGHDLEIENVTPGDLGSESSVLVKPGGIYEVDFIIRSPGDDGRSAVRIVCNGRRDLVPTVLMSEYFDVIGTGVPSKTDAPGEETAAESDKDVPAGSEAAASESPGEAGNWEAIDDENVRRLLQFLAKHGTVDEADAMEILGGARQLRRFALRLTRWQQYVSFGIHVEVTATGKRYVKE